MKTRFVIFIIFSLIVLFCSFLLFFDKDEILVFDDTMPVEEFRVAFLADQGYGHYSMAVLNLIKHEEVDLVLHQGDFDYLDDPKKWDAQISNVLGNSFPYFASIGNHDTKAWGTVIPLPRPIPDLELNLGGGYQEKLENRLEKNPEIQCIGDLGVQSVCSYKNLLFVTVAPGIKGTNHHLFIDKQMRDNNFNWKICSWHLNMSAMQIGKKQDETGWEVYDECKNNGAMIVSGHDHSYARTKTLIDFGQQIVDKDWSESHELRLKQGSSFVVVSGLGGHSIRNQENCFPTAENSECNDIWASVYSGTQNANFGALFCTFNVGENPEKAICYFKNIDGDVIDNFSITSFIGKV